MTRWTDMRVAACIQRILAGETLEAIGDDLGVSRAAVSAAILRRTGLSLAEIRRRRHALDLLVSCELGNLGLTARAAAERLEVDERTIERWWREARESGLSEAWRDYTARALPSAGEWPADPAPLSHAYCATRSNNRLP